MDERIKLIVGIDPGTTTGYAVFDVKGNLIETGAAKELALEQLISKIVALGNVLIVGCDKAKVPDLVSCFATKVGAKVICPDEDLLVDEKRKLAQNLPYKNTHEMDAVACALFAWKNVEPLFRKIDLFLLKENKTQISQKVKSIVIKNSLSIKSAVQFIETGQESQTQKTINLTKEILPKKEQKPSKLLMQKEKVLQIKEEKRNLICELLKSKKLAKQLEKKIGELEHNILLDTRLAQKEKRIVLMSTLIEQKEQKIQELREQNSKLFQLLSKSKDNIIMPRLKNLGWQEFSNKTQKFQINPQDLIFVDDPYSFSQQTLEELRKNNITILSQRIAQNNTLFSLGIAVLQVGDIAVEFHPTMAVIKKADMDRKRKEKFWMQDIVEEYQQERKTTLQK